MIINEYIDKAKKKLNISSDKEFSLSICMTKDELDSVRKCNSKNIEKTEFTYLAFNIANILKENATKIIVDVHTEIEKDPKKLKFWNAKKTASGF